VRPVARSDPTFTLSYRKLLHLMTWSQQREKKIVVGIGRDKTLPNMRRTWGTEAEQKFIWVLDAPCVGPIGTPPTSFTGNSLRDLIYLSDYLAVCGGGKKSGQKDKENIPDFRRTQNVGQ
jgi:hypothetical protein